MSDDIAVVEDPDFTMSDLLTEIGGVIEPTEDFERNEEGFYTSTELAAIKGMDVRRVRSELHKLKIGGRLEVGRKIVQLLDNTTRTVPAYKLIEKQEE